MKNEKNMRVFLYIKYSKYWSKSLENFVEHKDFMYLFKYICILNSFKTFFSTSLYGEKNPLITEFSCFKNLL